MSALVCQSPLGNGAKRKSSVDSLYDCADGAAEAAAAGALPGAGGTDLPVTLGAWRPGPLALLAHTAACVSRWCT